MSKDEEQKKDKKEQEKEAPNEVEEKIGKTDLQKVESNKPKDNEEEVKIGKTELNTVESKQLKEKRNDRNDIRKEFDGERITAGEQNEERDPMGEKKNAEKGGNDHRLRGLKGEADSKTDVSDHSADTSGQEIESKDKKPNYAEKAVGQELINEKDKSKYDGSLGKSKTKDPKTPNFNVPDINLEEIGDEDSREEEEDITPNKRSRKSVPKKKSDQDRNQELSDRNLGQYHNYEGSEEDSFVDEFSDTMSRARDEMLFLECSFDSNIDSSEPTNLTMKAESDIDQHMNLNDSSNMCPNIDVETSGQLYQTKAEQAVVEEELDHQNGSSRPLESFHNDDDDDGTNNNNDESLISANTLKRRSLESSVDQVSNAASSEPLLLDVNNEALEEPLRLNADGPKTENEKNETFEAEIQSIQEYVDQRGAPSFDSGIDNESVVSEQSSTAGPRQPQMGDKLHDEHKGAGTAESNLPDEKLQNLKNDEKLREPKIDEEKPQNLKNEERLQKPNVAEKLQNMKNEEKLQSQYPDETDSLNGDMNDRIQRENEKNDRKSTLRKQHMVMDSDEDDDDTRSRSLSIHDDDYFASTESLGMGLGLSRESLAFSQVDLFRPEPISEKEEYMSRTSSKDTDKEEDVIDADVIEPRQQTTLDAAKFSEYSEEIESSDLLSSDPEDYGIRIAKQAHEISAEISSLNQAWSETTSYTEYTESSFYTTDLDGISFDGVPDTNPRLANQINVQEHVRDVRILDPPESTARATKAKGTECAKDISNAEEIKEETIAPCIHTVDESLPSINQKDKSKVDAVKRKYPSEQVEETRGTDDMPLLKESTSDVAEVVSPAGKKGVHPAKTDELFIDKDVSGVNNFVSPDQSAAEKSKVKVTGELENFAFPESNITSTIVDEPECASAPLSRKPKSEENADTDKFPKVDIDSDIEHKTKDAKPGYDITADVTTRDKKKAEPEFNIQATTDVTSKEKPQVAAKILSATSDVTIDAGESIVLEWEIRGRPSDLFPSNCTYI